MLWKSYSNLSLFNSTLVSLEPHFDAHAYTTLEPTEEVYVVVVFDPTKFASEKEVIIGKTEKKQTEKGRLLCPRRTS